MNPVENEQVCSSCATAIVQGAGRLASVPALIKRIIADQMWKERKIRTGEIIRLERFRDLILRDPLEGWGEDPAKIEALIRDDADALSLWREAMTPPKHKHSDSDNVTIRGNSRAYTLSRLKIEQPKLFEEVKAGRLSANAAAIKAGFRKAPSTIEQLKKLWNKANASDKREFRKWIK